jgi:hypothetical protein
MASVKIGSTKIGMFRSPKIRLQVCKVLSRGDTKITSGLIYYAFFFALAHCNFPC